MCGIAGIMSRSGRQRPDLEQISTMMAPLRHRGPDQSGVYLDPDLAMANLRLSIIGLGDGIQPIGNEDGTLWIVYNGEAFNYLELKAELIEKGHRFATSTDTEVLLHLYEEYGSTCLQRINGQFALAIWDSRKKELFLARDRVGIRPLFYVDTAERLCFASEIKAILALEGTRELDLESLAEVFTLWTTVPGRTVFQGVRELPPGHFLVVQKGRPSVPQPYWQIPFYPCDPALRGADEAAEQLRELLTDAVRLRLRADVPVGAYLSGGLDSSIIATLISRHGTSHLRTFSLGFQAAPFDESRYQRELIDHLGADNRQVLVSNEQIRAAFPDTVWHCEKPMLRTAPVPMFLLSRLVRDEGYKVVLSGEGADEILGGYNIFKEAKIRQFWSRYPASQRRPLLLEKLYPYIFSNPSRERHYLQEFFAVRERGADSPFFSHEIRWENSRKNLTFLSDDCRSALAVYDPLARLAETLPEGFAERDLLARAQHLEMELFLAGFLLSSQGDRVGMAHSVEMRHPFLDYRVIDFAFRLPARWKLRGLKEKYLLKRAFRGVIPESINNRDKQPYRAPIRELFSAQAPRDYVDDLLSETRLRESGYFNPHKVARLYAKFLNTPAGLSSEFQNMALVGALSTQILHEQFVKGERLRALGRVTPDRVVRGGETPAPHRGR
ncbi:asparagine synthase (glutamine-hydrolyzing) [Geomonas silvestris]|nr:asparagine synthase (glutamine-hydrolyzing) [Geomonas silvestris]